MKLLTQEMIEWLFSFHPKNKNKDYVQGWYCIGIKHGSKYRKRRAVLEFVCRLFTGHELSTTEWGWCGGEMVDGHCRWCDKVIKMPVSEARFRYKSFNDFGVRTKFED